MGIFHYDTESFEKGGCGGVKDIRLRSFMYLPASNRKFIEKAIDCNADAIILDMEDSVPESRRAEARDNIIEYDNNGFLKKRGNVYIRINPIGTKDFVEDITRLTLDSVDGFMPSKIDTPDDLVFIDKLLSFFELKKGFETGKYKLTPLIETTKAIEYISEIAASSKRLLALCLGGEDYLNDLGSVYTYQQSALEYPRSRIVNAARANGLLPIDTPFLDINDIEAFLKNETQAYKNGFAGIQVLNPKQIDAANRAFSPDEEKVEISRRVIAAVEAARKNGEASVAMLDGEMVGPPMLKRAMAVMEQISKNE